MCTIETAFGEGGLIFRLAAPLAASTIYTGFPDGLFSNQKSQYG
jgi:hypothetical protein